MSMGFPDKTPFTNKELEYHIKRRHMVAGIIGIVALIFVLLGVIGELANVTLGLSSLTWLLLAIFVMYGSLHNRWIWSVACNLYGMGGKAIKK